MADLAVCVEPEGIVLMELIIENFWAILGMSFVWTVILVFVLAPVAKLIWKWIKDD